MKILAILRGFPGLGRVVAGVSILEELRDQHGFKIKMISYLQGNLYLKTRGYSTNEVSPRDYCPLGLLPTSLFGADIHRTISEWKPNLILIDGEPLMLHSIKLSHPSLPVITLLNPSDVENPHNDKAAMDYFRNIYAMADLAIVHGLQRPSLPSGFKATSFYAIDTILRKEILSIKRKPSRQIYCILGGGTTNTDATFFATTLRMAELCLSVAHHISDYQFHIVCANADLCHKLTEKKIPSNVTLYQDILSPETYYINAEIILTRAGRNTLSEVAFLQIPTLVFVTGDIYRQEEQRQNVAALQHPQICCMDLESNPAKLISAILSILSHHVGEERPFCDNQEAIRAILYFIEQTIDK